MTVLCRPSLATLKRTVAPTVEPLSTAEALAHLHMTRDDDQSRVAALLAAARGRVEDFTERALLTQTWRLKLDGWPSGDLELPRAPLLTVVSIVYATDATTGTSTVSTDVYEVDTDSEPGRVRLKPNQTWPTDIYARPRNVTITWTAGFGATADDVPEPIREATRLLLGHYERQGEAVLTGTIQAPLIEGVEALLAPWRLPWD